MPYDAGTEIEARPASSQEAGGEARTEGGAHPPSQAACDRLTEMAARVIDAPAAVLSVLHKDRPFLMASSGLADSGGTWGTTPLTVSLSHHAGSSREPFVLEDVHDHPLLADDPAVDALGLVSFLGVPLLDGNDEVLGILGVMDRRGRSWTGEETRNLEDIARAVETEIELRGAVQEVRRTERETATRTEARTRRSFLDLIHGIDAIISERNLASGDFTFVSRKAVGLLGYPVERWLESGDFWSDVLVHPDDRDRAVEALQAAVEGREDVDLEYRVRTADGRTLWLRDRIRVATDDEGTPALLRGIMVDVTSRKEAAEELARREAQLAEAQRLARLGSWEWDMEADVVTWSEQLHRIFGIEPGTVELDYNSYIELLPEDDRRAARDAVREALERREGFSFEHRIVRPDGEERQILGQGRIVVDEDGAPVRMVGTAQDITEQKRLEKRARALAAEKAARAEAEAARAEIQRVLESITDAFFAVDREWRLTVLNSEASRLFEGDRDDLLGRELWEAFPDEVDSTFGSAYRRAMDERTVVDFEAYYEPAQSWFEVRAYPSEDGLSVYLHDINERKRTERALRESEERYRFLADSVPQQIWTARPDGRYDYVNRVVVAFSGRDGEDLTGDGWMKLVHPDDVDEVTERWSRALESGERYEVECRLTRHDGEARWHLVRAHPQHGEDGEILKWFGTSTDIHDQKRAEAERDQALEDLEKINYVLESDRSHLERQARELRETTRALEKSNQDLDQFAYVASHDLKAPLRGIANLTEWLEEDLSGRLDDDTREYMDLLKSRVHRMEALIDGILQYSRAGRGESEMEWVDTGELAREVVDMLDPPERFTVEIDPTMPTLLTPRAPLQQVFLNLASNAVKHADGEEPRIRIRCPDEGIEWYEFSVEDNGPGIPDEYRQKIWTLFQTLKPRDEVEGTGIGLSVVKRTVEHHGGQVWVESEESVGATFRFLWPRNIDSDEEET